MRTPGRIPLMASLCAIAFAGAPLAMAEKPPKADPPPPPSIDDPGVATPPADAKDAEAANTATDAKDDPLAPLPKPDTRLVRDKASRVAASEVSTRKEGGDTIEEYRQHGRVWMIRIHPANGGPVQTFMDSNGNGRLNPDPREGPVSPVYYTLYEWN